MGININELTIGDLKEIRKLLGDTTSTTTSLRRHNFEIGKCYSIQGVTRYHVGRVVEITELGVILEDSGWVADTGRWHEYVKTGDLLEFEPTAGRIHVHFGAMSDDCEWPHPLPKAVK